MSTYFEKITTPWPKRGGEGGVNPYALTVSCKKTPKKNFLTTDPPLPPSLWLTVINLGFVKISYTYTYQYKYMLKMHFSASSQ